MFFLVVFQLNQMFGENSSSSRRQCFPSSEPKNEVPRSVHGVAVWAAERGIFLQEDSLERLIFVGAIDG